MRSLWLATVLGFNALAFGMSQDVTNQLDKNATFKFVNFIPQSVDLFIGEQHQYYLLEDNGSLELNNLDNKLVVNMEEQLATDDALLSFAQMKTHVLTKPGVYEIYSDNANQICIKERP